MLSRKSSLSTCCCQNCISKQTVMKWFNEYLFFFYVYIIHNRINKITLLCKCWFQSILVFAPKSTHHLCLYTYMLHWKQDTYSFGLETYFFQGGAAEWQPVTAALCFLPFLVFTFIFLAFFLQIYFFFFFFFSPLSNIIFIYYTLSPNYLRQAAPVCVHEHTEENITSDQSRVCSALPFQTPPPTEYIYMIRVSLLSVIARNNDGRFGINMDL